MASTARHQQLLPIEPALPILDDADYGSCDLARDLGLDTAYNQEAFRYFLANERKRSELSQRPFLLLLVDLQQSHLLGHIEPPVATKLFAGLAQCLRDTDVIGWYHEGRVAGAVLTHVEGATSIDVAGEVRGRVTALLRDVLPVSHGKRLQVRLYQLPAGLSQ